MEVKVLFGFDISLLFVICVCLCVSVCVHVYVCFLTLSEGVFANIYACVCIILTVSSGIMERHGGTIGVTSTGLPGQGCVFFVEVPMDNWQSTTRASSPPHDLQWRSDSTAVSVNVRGCSSGDAYGDEHGNDDESASSTSSSKPLFSLTSAPSFLSPYDERNLKAGQILPQCLTFTSSPLSSSPSLPLPSPYTTLENIETDADNVDYMKEEGRAGNTDSNPKVWRALIVDDSKLNVKMARRILSDYFDELLEVST